ncbi:MAG: prolyl oligopeptidase family serine peptidase [Bacteroidota bacterium]
MNECKQQQNNSRKRIRLLIFLSALLPVFVILYATKSADKSSVAIEKKGFQKKIFIQGNDTLRYQFFVPKATDSMAKLPLILFLHGAGERGNDNEAQAFHAKKFFGSAEFQAKHPCFVMAPQCPVKKRWAEIDWSLPKNSQPPLLSTPLSLTLTALRSICKEFNIDTNRLYITGLSMGGFGTWDAITRYPSLFAAAVPVCGGGDETKAILIKDHPVWAFHGDKDKAVMVQRSRNMIEAIRNAGGNPKYTEYPGVGHNCWDQAYSTSEMIEWLFLQNKKKK